MRKLLGLSTLLAAALAAPLTGAQPAVADVAGAWECRLPGQSTRTPPILWIASQPAAEGNAQPTGPESLEVDGFAGVVRGEGRFASGADGWSQFEPSGSVSLWIKPATVHGRPALQARLGAGGRAYRCARLPYPKI